jgi:hypothetical protein
METNIQTISQQIEAKRAEIYALINSIDIDANYHLEDEDLTSADNIRDTLDNSNAFDVEIIYYSRAIEYLSKHDSSLKISLSLAHEMGFSLDKLNSETLASILATENVKEDFSDIERELDELCEELQTLIEEEEAAEEETEEEEEEEEN